MRSVARVLVGAFGSILVFSAAALAQSGGTLHGRVTDSTGAPVHQAAVSVDGTGLRVSTDERGRYRIASLPPGSYLVRVRRLGLAAEPARVTIVEGETVERDFTMRRVPAALTPVEVVVGSRAAHTAADELAVPVDVFTLEQIRAQGTTETAQILSQLAPSVNFPRQSVADATEIVRPFTMRGLSPDHTLVLLDGKRRHHTALVHYYGAGMGAGSSGVDMNALPASAIERLEVLRDGAAAQYGSDAIAGVVNLVLRKGVFAPTLSVDYGKYTPRDFPADGATFDASGAWGLPLGRGSLALSAEYRDRGKTNRAGADPVDQVVPGDADTIDGNGKVIKKNNPVPQPNHHWGDGGERAFMSFMNATVPLDRAGNAGLYAFGGYSARRGEGFGYYRQAMSERNWTQIYPLGFLPKFAPRVTDASAVAGVRGLAAQWSYDVGYTFGHNAFAFDLSNTLNTSLGPCLDTPCAPGKDGILGTPDDPGIPNQTAFFAGKLKLFENIVSADASRQLAVGLPSPLNLALGVAYRRETYQIIAGETASWIQGWHADVNGDIAPSGSQVFPGFRPEDATNASRDNVGAYVDLESDIAPKLLANVAGRYEHYSDFGAKLTGKLAMRYRPTTRLTLRGALSTGFRAPSLNQSFYSSTVTDFKTDPVTGNPLPFEIGIFPVHSLEARSLGARPLRAESSVNVSAGLAFSPTPRVDFTADVYQIDVNDRIMLTTFLSSDSVAAILRAAGSRAEAGQYFTNALDTRTRGVDVTANWRVPVSRGALELGAVYNYTTNALRGDIPLPAELVGTGVVLFDEFSEGGLLALTKERPRWRGTLTAQYRVGAWSVLGRGAFYGTYSSALYGYCAACVQEYPSATLFDAEAAYAWRRGVRVALGARNLFDTFPGRMKDVNSFGIFLYPSASPFGFNGRFVYTRVEWTGR